MMEVRTSAEFLAGTFLLSLLFFRRVCRCEEDGRGSRLEWSTRVIMGGPGGSKPGSITKGDASFSVETEAMLRFVDYFGPAIAGLGYFCLVVSAVCFLSVVSPGALTTVTGSCMWVLRRVGLAGLVRRTFKYVGKWAQPAPAPVQSG